MYIGPTERAVQIAKLEIKRVLKEELLRQVSQCQYSLPYKQCLEITLLSYLHKKL